MKDAAAERRPAQKDPQTAGDGASPKSAAQLAAENARLRQEVAGLAARLIAIETSTSWRAMVRIHRVIWWFRSLTEHLQRALRALTRAMRAVFAGPSVSADLLETCRVPVWDGRARNWTLVLDKARLRSALRAKSQVTATTTPYVVRPVRAPQPGRRRPRVLHVIANVYVGGSTQLVIDLLEHLADRYDQDVLTAALWPGGAHHGMTVHHVPAPADGARLTALLADRQPDLVHIHYWGLTDELWYRAVMQTAAATRCKIVENINTPIAPLIHPRVDHYAYVSAYVRDTFGKGADDTAHASVIHPGIDLSKFDGVITDTEAADAIGMVYRLEPDKLSDRSIALFIEIARRRPRTKIYIIGGGSLFHSFLAQTEAAGVRANFHFTGYVPYDQLPAWYSRFCIFVAPVWQESFGQVSVFGMNKGQAVGGFKVGALPEILGYDDTFGEDVTTAAEKIVALLDDPARRRALGERNRLRAQSAFSVEGMTARYGEIYDRLLAGAP